MRLIDTIRRAGRSLRQAKARTLLTSLAIGVGAFTVTLSFAAGAGGRQYAQDIIAANTNAREIRVTQKQNDSTTDLTKPQEYSNSPTLTLGPGFTIQQLKQSDVDKIASLDGIESVSPLYNLSVQYVTAEGAKKYQASVDTYDSSIAIAFDAGSAEGLKDNEIILPASYVEVLGLGSAQDAIGKTVTLVVEKGSASQLAPESKAYNFTVKAVQGINPLAFASGSSLLVSKATTKEMYTYNTENTSRFGVYTAVFVFAKEGVDTAKLRDSINQLGYHAQTAKDVLSTIFQFIDVLQAILLGFGALAILTSVFGIINTQYISVLERTQQIGLMKALGMRRRDVGRLFKLEAAWIGFLGGAIGSGLAVVAGTIANPYINDYLDLGEGQNLLIFQPYVVVGVIVGLMIVAVLAGILPARKASKLDPIEALRTE